MIEKTVVVGPFQCNCRILACPETGHAAIVDPGDEPARILRALVEAQTAFGRPFHVKYLLHTHAHLDHIGGTRALKEALVKAGAVEDPRAVASIALHRADEDLYRNLKMQGSLFGLEYEEPLPIEHFLEDEEELRLGMLRLSVIHTPGHSPGGVCFRLREDSALGASESVYSGDTLFQGSIGRTDLWGGDTDQLLSSIRRRLLTLDEDTRVCPGHGPESLIGVEKRENPFL
jgi:glyoxylase-like metal-dependent hydrolase (beta-lactamase superfamily II)